MLENLGKLENIKLNIAKPEYTLCFICGIKSGGEISYYYKVYQVEEKKIYICLDCNRTFYCRVHNMFDNCDENSERACFHIIHHHINPVYAVYCREKFSLTKKEIITSANHRAIIVKDTDSRDYNNILCNSPYYVHCIKHRYRCDYGYDSLEQGYIFCENFCPFYHVDIDAEDLNLDLPLEIKYIILKYFNYINGCGKH